MPDAQDALYLGCVVSAVFATGLLVAPVAVHRVLFRRHARRVSVEAAARLAQAGMILLGLAIVGVVALIFSVVAGTAAGWAAGVLAALMVAALWWALPHRLDRTSATPEN